MRMKLKKRKIYDNEEVHISSETFPHHPICLLPVMEFKGHFMLRIKGGEANVDVLIEMLVSCIYLVFVSMAQ